MVVSRKAKKKQQDHVATTMSNLHTSKIFKHYSQGAMKAITSILQTYVTQSYWIESPLTNFMATVHAIKATK